jgi:hypothetical protein
MKKLIEWAEAEVTRARKLMLFSTIFVYLIITFAVLILYAIGKPLTGFEAYYFSFSSVAAVAIAFYTGTTAKNPSIKNENTITES